MDTQLIETLLVALKNASTTPNHSPAHGPSGLFNAAADPKVFNAIYGPTYGLMSRLPVRMSNYESETHEILTAIGANSGSHPTQACDPGKISGTLQEKKMIFAWGNRKFSTRTLAVSEVGKLLHRGEFTDFRLIGDPTAQGNVSPSINPRDVLNSEVQKMLLETKMGWAAEFGRQVITGNPANNSGNYTESQGLAILVNSGLLDSTAAALPAQVQPIVRAAIADNLNTQAATAGPLVLNDIRNTVRALTEKASRTGLLPVTWEFVGSRNLFNSLIDIWPCNYNTVGCVGTAGNPISMSAESVMSMRQEMRDGSFLWVDGQRLRYNIDDGVAETEGSGVDPNTGTGNYTSSLYLVPIYVAGREPATFVEAYNFNNPMSVELIAAIGRADKFKFEQNGRFMWIYRENDECLSASMRERSRLIVKAPWLSARWTSLRYRPAINVPPAF